MLRHIFLFLALTLSAHADFLSSHGFCFVDVGLTAEDLAEFQKIDVQREKFYHEFGDFEKMESQIADFICEIGCNERSFALKMGERIGRLAREIMVTSGRETAWVHLRAHIPTPAYDITRWHIDGNYFKAAPGELMYKIAVTLQGPSTLFYPLTEELRRIALKHMLDRIFMHQFCMKEHILSAPTGQGAMFLAGNIKRAALHSEPPIHENRLFFSVVPCGENQLNVLKTRVFQIYPK